MAQNNLMAAVAYLFHWLSGLIVYFISKDDKFARFHALQSILFDITMFVVFIVVAIIGFVLMIALVAIGAAINVPIIALIGSFALPIVMLIFILIAFLLWLWCMFQAFTGKWFKLPVIGGFAEKWSG